MRIFVTGGTGVLGRILLPLLRHDGHDVIAPGSKEVDLFDGAAVRSAVTGAHVVYHLATRIPPATRSGEPGAWDENNRLRSVATSVLVDAALEAGAMRFVLASVTFLYSAEGPADEQSPFGDSSGRLQSMLDAEAAARRFQAAGRHGVILRFGLLWGPGTGNDAPSDRYGSSVHVEDAGEALRKALVTPGDVYNVVGDGQRISNRRFKATTGWHPRL